MISLAGLQHEFALTVDSVRQKLMSLTVYPANVYDAGHEECSTETLKDKKSTKVGGRVVVTNIRELPR